MSSRVPLGPSPDFRASDADEEMAFPEDWRSADVDRPEEDSVLLAPKRDFTPGGTPRGEGGGADIESPFARPSKSEDAEWVPPDSGIDGASAVATERPVPQGSVIALTSLPGAKVPDPDLDGFPPLKPLSSGRPSPIEPRSLRPTSRHATEGIQPSKGEPPDPGPAPSGPSLLGLALDDDGPPIRGGHASWDMAAEDMAAEPGSPHHPDAPRFDLPSTRPLPKARFDDDRQSTRRRPVERLYPTPLDQAPEAPPPPTHGQRPAASFAQGGHGSYAGLVGVWAVYSRKCHVAQKNLMRLSGRALSHGLWLASIAGSELSHLGGLGLRGLRVGAAHGRVGAEAAARSSRRLTGKALVLGGKTLRQARPALTSATGAMLPFLASAREAMALVLASTRAAFSRAPATDAVAKPANTSSPEASRKPDVTIGKAAAERLGAFFLTRKPSRLALGGLAAASIALLFAAIGSGPTPAPERALTFPLPERPEPRSTLPGPTAAIAEARALTLPDLSDPLADMIDFVDERLFAIRNATVLASAKEVEGLDQFLRAADVVGLERLLEPGEDYTIFAPNDDAFAELAPGEFDDLLEPAGHERLLILLSHHILPERLTFDDLAGDVRQYTSLAGQAVTIDTTDVIRVGDAGMVDVDLPAEHGILHIIDQVLPITTP